MSDKLQEAIRRAEQENLATKAKEKAQQEAKSAMKRQAKNLASKQAKKAAKGTAKLAKGAHRALGARSQTYAKAAQMAARGISVLKNTKAVMMLGKLAAAGGKLLAFLVTPILGWVVSLIIILVIIAIVNSGKTDDITAMLEQEEEEFYHYYTNNECPSPSENYSPIISDDSYASGDWRDEGSTAYNNAKLIFDIWVDAGLSGAAAAGIVGWINSEGGFHMFGRAEGYYSSNDPKDASLAYGKVPIPSTSGYQVGGGGTYQFTPYTKYAELGSPDWEDPIKMHDYLFSIFRGEVPGESAWLPKGNDMTGGNHSFEEFAQQTDPEYAVLMWNSYERANQAYVKPEQKKSDARFAYEAFGGAQYAFDPERFEATFGKKAEGYEHKPRQAAYDPCDPSVSGGGSWRGAGGQPSITGGMWLHPSATGPLYSGKSIIPDELREYALDPESVGLKFGKGDSWINKWSAGKSDGGQCTHLTSNLAELIWERDGEPIHNMRGNGREVVGNYAAKYGAAGQSTTPTGGAIFSTSEGATYCGSQKCGHTGIVSHVFDNGDFLVIETNMGGYSGDAIGAPYTYSYRYITKQKAIDAAFTFYDPSKVGFRLVPGIKSL